MLCELRFLFCVCGAFVLGPQVMAPLLTLHAMRRQVDRGLRFISRSHHEVKRSAALGIKTAI